MRLGAILGGGLLTKATAVLLLPITVLWLIVLSRSGVPKLTVAKTGLIAFTVAAALSGWWFVRNGIYYHEWLPLSAFQDSFKDTAKATDVISGKLGLHVDGWLGYAQLVATWTFQSFFAVYTTSQGAVFGIPVFLPRQLYLLSGAAQFGSTIGLASYWVRNRSDVSGVGITRTVMLLATLILIVSSFVAFAAKYFQAQGRYLYPAMMPISLLTAMGWRALFPQKYVDMASVALLLFLALFCFAFVQAIA